MAASREQFGCDPQPPHPKSSVGKRWLKRFMARWLRRQAKRLPEDAPRQRRYSGRSA
jgi:hypothetical protein